MSVTRTGRRGPTVVEAGVSVLLLAVLVGVGYGLLHLMNRTSAGTTSPEPSPTTSVIGPVVAYPTPGTAAPVDAEPTAAAGTVSAGQALDADPGPLDGTLGTYPLPDGTWLVVDTTQPLPDAVLADLTARAATVATATGPGERAAGFEALQADAAGTGRVPVFVFPADVRASADADAAPGWMLWARAGASTWTEGADTRDEALSAAERWVEQQDDPAVYLVVAQAAS
jgi:hypothetical protein